MTAGANFFEAAHEREYRDALFFQRKYAEAAKCAEAIARSVAQALAQIAGGRKHDDLRVLAAELCERLPDHAEFAAQLGLFADVLGQWEETLDEAAVTPPLSAIDSRRGGGETTASNVEPTTFDLTGTADRRRVARRRSHHGRGSVMEAESKMSLDQKIRNVETLLRHVAQAYAPAVFANSFGAEDMVVTDLIARNRRERHLHARYRPLTRRDPYPDAGVHQPVPAAHSRLFPERVGRRNLREQQGANAFLDSVELRKAAAACARWNRCGARSPASAPGSPACAVNRRDPRRGALRRARCRAGLQKFNPLVDWTRDDVWSYIRAQQGALQRPARPRLPQHRLRALHPRDHGGRGRPRRALVVGDPERKECGLHVGGRAASERVRVTVVADSGECRRNRQGRFMKAVDLDEIGVLARPSQAPTPKGPGAALSHLDVLESEAIHILREVAAECRTPALLFSGGKDSIVMLRLAEKAFRPGRFPFPLLHIDTGHNFPEVIAFRDRARGRARRAPDRAVRRRLDRARGAWC